MRDDQKFEIERAFDLLPHVVGSSWTVTWFRFNKIKNPTPDEYRRRVIKYLEFLDPLFESFSDNENFVDIQRYISARKKEEVERILNGENKEVEKRYDRYLDYG